MGFLLPYVMYIVVKLFVTHCIAAFHESFSTNFHVVRTFQPTFPICSFLCKMLYFHQFVSFDLQKFPAIRYGNYPNKGTHCTIM